MVRFSVDGDDDGNRERPSNNRPLPKRLRICEPIVYTHRRTTGSPSVVASTSNAGDRPAAAAAETRAGESVETREESEDQSGEEEEETSWDHSSSYSSEESDEGEQENQRSANEDLLVSVSERLNSALKRHVAPSEPEGLSGAVSVTLTDPDVLDCPICYEPLCSPVYQCENGHIACSSCCNTMKNKCANCCWPIGYNRCRAIEKVLESIKITCRNTPYGCKEILSYSKKLAHEKTCSYMPCSCPYGGCDFTAVSKSLYTHFSQQHSSKRFSFNSVISISMDNTQKHIFLQEMSQNTLFILTRSVETVGSFVNVVCVAPSLERRLFSYEVIATVGESSIRLKTPVDVMTKWTTHPPSKVRLLVPCDFISVSGLLRLDLFIRRNPSVDFL